MTGSHGLGKSALMHWVLEHLQLPGHTASGSSGSGAPSSGSPAFTASDAVTGFYTEQVHAGIEHVGFNAVTLNGHRGPLARAGTAPKVSIADTSCNLLTYM